jgi:hypothetical protein
MRARLPARLPALQPFLLLTFNQTDKARQGQARSGRLSPGQCSYFHRPTQSRPAQFGSRLPQTKDPEQAAAAAEAAEAVDE